VSTTALRQASPPGDPLAALGLAILSTALLAALLAPWLPLADPYGTDLANRMAPAFAGGHPLGTDHLGRDLLSRTVWGLRSSLAVGIFATLLAGVIGSLIGLTAGYAGRWADALLMRSVDVLMGFPYLLLALAIVAALGPGLRNAMIAIAIANVPFFARAVRGVVVSLRQRQFIEAARLAGAGHLRIMASEILPNAAPAILVMLGTTLGWMVLETAGLSFLGLGAQPPRADLGSMLGQGREFLATQPRVAVVPGLVVFVVVVGINVVADWLRDRLDPRLGRSQLGTEGPRVALAARSAESPEELLPGAVLELRGLRVEFPQAGRMQPVVDDVSLRLSPGERVALVGESGSGKTQSALAVLGLVTPPGRVAAGRIVYRGEDLALAGQRRLRRLRGDRIAYIAQDPTASLDPLFTVGDQVLETLRAHQRLTCAAGRRRALELLREVRLPAACFGSYPHQLSGGMRQRALIAMALANGPDLLIADEATTALDVTVQAQILALLDQVCHERGTALILITHDLGLVSLCERAMVMYAGRVVEAAPVPCLFARPLHPYSRALIACAPELGNPEKSAVPIPGSPPAPGALPAGCHFAPRCPHAAAICRGEPMGLLDAEPSRRVRCVRWKELVS
jgi:peptide/nickel transport system permease protein